ncbi:hypothetical protein [Janthinobacterium agaricidamnosum]|nr:hypothetical protein [Janthinobacterium agaricidamnosum]
MKLRNKKVVKLGLVLAAVAALGGAVMLLWNAVVPGVFAGSNTIDYWHALGLLLLCRILFGGFRGHGGWNQRHHWQRWQAMTEEEREQFRKNMASVCQPPRHE